MSLKEILSGGDPRSLKGVDETINLVTKDRKKISQLFDLLFETDPVLVMRVSDALEKICRENPAWFTEYIDRLLNDVSRIKQPSVQWHLAQMFSELRLDNQQKSEAIEIMKSNLAHTDDWIVTNLTLESLANFVRRGDLKSSDFLAIVKRYESSNHKSVTHRAEKLIKEFSINR